jgi:hypothetical protein
MMNEKFEQYIELDNFIEKEYDHLIKKTHGKGLARVRHEFLEKITKKWKAWSRAFVGGYYSYRIYSKNGFEYVYLYAGLKNKILLFKLEGNEILDFFREYAKKFGINYKLIDLFFHVHNNHDTYLESVPYSHIDTHRIVCSTCDKNLDLTDYENY